MNPLQFAAGDVLLLVAGSVVEVFHRSYDRSFREPAAWIGVQVEQGRHDRVKVTIGRSRGPADPIYSGDTAFSWVDLKFDLDSGDEPGLRAFFAEVASAAGRT